MQIACICCVFAYCVYTDMLNKSCVILMKKTVDLSFLFIIVIIAMQNFIMLNPSKQWKGFKVQRSFLSFLLFFSTRNSSELMKILSLNEDQLFEGEWLEMLSFTHWNRFGACFFCRRMKRLWFLRWSAMWWKDNVRMIMSFLR